MIPAIDSGIANTTEHNKLVGTAKRQQTAGALQDLPLLFAYEGSSALLRSKERRAHEKAENHARKVEWEGLEPLRDKPPAQNQALSRCPRVPLHTAHIPRHTLTQPSQTRVQIIHHARRDRLKTRQQQEPALWSCGESQSCSALLKGRGLHLRIEEGRSLRIKEQRFCLAGEPARSTSMLSDLQPVQDCATMRPSLQHHHQSRVQCRSTCKDKRGARCARRECRRSHGRARWRAPRPPPRGASPGRRPAAP